ncbi:Ig-like domain-containing protein [Leifsonia sp. NPDC058292]|uniref:Ig-like domain-containing protein n=1 Tax=Leifsonia sp. NPDC058292 TaxID=3346428 RepID=UPI0036D7F1E5
MTALAVAAASVLTAVGVAAPANAATTAPEVYSVLGAEYRVDSYMDEIRADFVLRVPKGSVNPATGAGLSLSYDYGNGTIRTARIKATNSAAGATTWAQNIDEFYTIHQVISSGPDDFLVMSLEGDLNLPDNGAGSNVPGGLPITLNLYSTVTVGGVASAQTTTPMQFYSLSGRNAAATASGPGVQIVWDNVWRLWSGGQANWGQVLDYGLNGQAPGVLPAKSVAIPLMNPGFSSAASGPAGSVSDSFWYQWVNEDGSPVTAINSQPIHVTGVTPFNGGSNATRPVATTVYNAAPASNGQAAGYPAMINDGSNPALGSAMKADGSIDFSEAGGTGYYKLLVWPESHNPTTVTVDNGAPQIMYSTPPTDATQAFTPASVFYNYDVPRPDEVTITAPADKSLTSNPNVVVTGTGTPGATITLIQDGTTLVDGYYGNAVTVAGDGSWSYALPSALPDATYTIQAEQTEHTTGYGLTSDPVTTTFTIDTKADAAVAITAPRDGLLTTETSPAISGTGAVAGSTVTVYANGTKIGSVVATSGDWSLTPESPLADGNYALTAKQFDAAGNESPVSNTVNITVKSQADAAPVITAPADGSSTTDTTPTITGTGVAGNTVTVLDGATTLGTATVKDDGTWTLTPAALSGGAHSFTATQVDGVGLTSAVSNTVTITIETTPSASQSAISLAPTSAVADGTATITATVTIKGTNGGNMPGQKVTPTVPSGVTAGAVTDNGDGTYTFTLTSTKAGSYELGAAVEVSGNPVQITPQTGTFTAGAVVASKSTYQVTGGAVAADGIAAQTVTVNTADANGNPAAGEATITVAAPAVFANGTQTITVATGQDGQGTAPVMSSVAGTYQVSASSGGSALSIANGQGGTATFQAGAAVAEKSTFTVTPAGPVAANGNAAYTGTVTANDANGNPVNAAVVSIDVPNGLTAKDASGNTLAVSNGKATLITGTNGVAAVSFTAITAATFPVGAYLGAAQIGTTHDLAFSAGTAVVENSSWTLAPAGPLTADGVTAYTATITLRDANNNLVTGATDVTVTSGSGSTVTAVADQGDGTYTALITSVTAGSYIVRAALSGTQIGSTSNAQFIAGAPSLGAEGLSTLSVTQGIAYSNGSDVQTATAVVVDANNNPVQGVAVAFAATGGAALSSPTATTNASGVASVSVTSTTPGSFPVSATADGQTIKGSPQNAVFIAGSPSTGSTGKSTLAIDSSDGITADGAASHVVTATVRDSYGTPLSGVAVSFTADTGATLSGSAVLTDADGVATTQVVSTKAGSYKVSATVGGNTLNPANVTANFIAGAPSLGENGTSTVTIDDKSAQANGTDTHTVTATVLDAFGNPISGVVVQFGAASGANLTAGSGVTDASGVVTTTVSSTQVGSYPISATVNGTALKGSPVTATFSAGSPSVGADGTSTVTATTGNRTADGVDSHSITSTIRDAQGNALPGVTVQFAVVPNGPQLSASTATTDANGQAVVQSISTVAGSYGVTASVNGTAVKGSPVTIAFVAGSPSTGADGKSSVAIDNNTVVANNSDTHTVTATVLDAFDNPVSGATVVFGASGSASLTAGSAVTDVTGVATTKVRSSVAGSFDVTATIAGSALKNSPVQAVFVAGQPSTGSTGKSTLTIDSSNGIAADGVQKHTVTATVNDAAGNPIQGVAVSFGAPSGTLSAGSAVTNASGVATTQISSTVAGTVPVTATVNGNTLNPASVDANFIAGAPSAEASTVTIDAGPKVANGQDKYTVTATIKDANGNVIPNASVAFTASTDAALSATSASTDNNGAAKITVTSTKAGAHSIAASVGGLALTGSPVTASFVAGPADASKSKLAIDNTSAVTADGIAAHLVTATIVDAFLNPVSGASVSFTAASGATLSASSGTTNGQGVATVSVTSTKTGQYLITGAISAGQISGSPVTAVFGAGAADAAKSNLTVSTGTVTADGSASHSAVVTVRDANGNIVSGALVDFSATDGAALSAQAAVSDANGQATIAITSTTAGTYSVSAAIGGAAVTGSPADVTFGAGAADAGKSSWTVTPNGPILADGSAKYTAVITARDSNGNIVSGQVITVTSPAGLTASSSSVTTGAGGTAEVTFTSVVAGTYAVQARIGGNQIGETAELEFLSAAKPSAPTIDPTNGSVVTGSAEPGNTVTVTDAAGNVIGETKADENGQWSLVPNPRPADGATITAVATSPSGIPSDPTSVTVDAKAPEAPVVDPTNGDKVTGSGEPGATVKITDEDGNEIGSGTVDENGKFEIVPSPKPGDGDKITVVQEDEAGNTSPGTEVTVDAKAPTAPIVDPSNGDKITGEAEPGSTVTVKDEDGNVIGETVAGPDGSWTMVPSPKPVDGDKVTATAKDEAGNTSPGTTITIDASAPEAPVVDPTNGSQVSGSAESGATIVVTGPDGSVLGTGTVQPDGTFTVPLSPKGEDGEVLSVTATDPAGNTSPKTNVTVDATAPAAPVLDPTNGDKISGSGGTPGDTITVMGPDGSVIGTTEVEDDGTWSVVPSPKPVDGDTVTATETDVAGNVSAPGSVTVDASAPEAPVVDPTNGDKVTGSGEPGAIVKITDEDGNEIGSGTVDENGKFEIVPSPKPGDGDKITVVQEDEAGNTSPGTEVTVDAKAPEAPVVDPTDGTVVTGQAEPGSTVTIKDDKGNEIGSGKADEEGNFSIVPSPKPGDGDTITVTAKDDAGNTSPGTDVVVDSAAPAAPVVDPTNGDKVTGEAEPGSTVTITDENGKEIGSGKVDENGKFEIVPSPKPGDGDKITVTAKDDNGNTSPGTEVVVDAKAPEAPVVDPTNGDKVTGSGEPGTTVKITDEDGNEIGSGTVDENGKFEIVPSPKPGDGDKITVVVEDEAGNTSPGTTVTVDSTAPDAPVVDETNGTVVTGAAEPGSTVTIRDKDGNVIGSGVAGPDGEFSIKPSPVPAIDDDISVTATDVAGNTSLPTVVTVKRSVLRIWGPDRYGTSVEVSKEAFPDTASAVFIASGENFPDALSAAPAAAKADAPVLLTRKDALPSAVAAEISRLNPQRIVFVGGTGAVSENVVKQVISLHLKGTITRLGGIDRYETSRIIALSEFKTSDKVFVASGVLFPDALSAAPAAGAIEAPVVLVNGLAAKTDQSTGEAIMKLRAKELIITGGTGAVSEGIETGMDAYAHVTRLWGADRYSTSVAINAWAFPTATTAYIAAGADFPDALSAAPLAARTKSPMYLAPATCIPQLVMNSIDKSGARQITLIGGRGVLNESVENLEICSWVEDAEGRVS